MMKPKVSIIIPVYNAEKYLKKCLDSVCNQTLKDIEIICINDCSTDESLIILQDYAANDNRMVIIDFQENKGVSTARNAGIKKASGEYIGFVDSDDYISIDFYEKLYSVAEDGVDIVKGKVKSITNDRICENAFVDYFDNNEAIKDSKGFFLLYFFTAIYRRELVDCYNIIFYEEFKYAEDLCFVAKAVALLNRVKCVDDAYYYYVKNDNSAIQNISKDVDIYCQSCILAAERMINDIYSKKPDWFVYETQFQQILLWILINSRSYRFDLKIEQGCFSTAFELYQGKSDTKQLYNNTIKEYNLYQRSLINILRGKMINKNKKTNSIIPIFLSSDNNYAPFVATTILSIVDNTRSYCNFYVLDGGIDEENKKKILTSISDKNNCHLDFLKLDTENIFKEFEVGGYFTLSIFNRLLIPELFKDIKKAIYLDVDVIVQGDIAELFKIDLKSFTIGATPDVGFLNFASQMKKMMDMSDESFYFNSGVLLIDLDKWREENAYDSILKIEKQYRGKYKGDQDLLNKYFENNFLELPIKYNSFSDINDIIVRHYASKPKPWEVLPELCVDGSKDFQTFWNYARQTPFYEQLLSDCKYTNKKEFDIRMRLMKMLGNI